VSFSLQAQLSVSLVSPLVFPALAFEVNVAELECKFGFLRDPYQSMNGVIIELDNLQDPLRLSSTKDH
jgi:hypothetical protein